LCIEVKGSNPCPKCHDLVHAKIHYAVSAPTLQNPVALSTKRTFNSRDQSKLAMQGMSKACTSLSNPARPDNTLMHNKKKKAGRIEDLLRLYIATAAF
jgi:hypothetical protein